jgi:hypothetical protein
MGIEIESRRYSAQLRLRVQDRIDEDNHTTTTCLLMEAYCHSVLRFGPKSYLYFCNPYPLGTSHAQRRLQRGPWSHKPNSQPGHDLRARGISVSGSFVDGSSGSPGVTVTATVCVTAS